MLKDLLTIKRLLDEPAGYKRVNPRTVTRESGRKLEDIARSLRIRKYDVVSMLVKVFEEASETSKDIPDAIMNRVIRHNRGNDRYTVSFGMGYCKGLDDLNKKLKTPTWKTIDILLYVYEQEVQRVETEGLLS